MAEPIKLDMVADRTLYFQQDLVFIDVDLTGATLLDMRLRVTPDAPGAPLIALDIVTSFTEGVRLQYAGTATIAAHIAAGRFDETIKNSINPHTDLPYADTDEVLVSHLFILALMDSRIPYPQERGDDTVLAYDLVAATPTLVGRKLIYGKFTVRGTVSF